MSERDWSFPTAVGIIAVVCTGFAIGLWGGAADSGHRQTDQPKASDHGDNADLSLLAEGGDRANTYQAICDKPRNRDFADLCQQWRSANSAAQSATYSMQQVSIGYWSLFGLVLTVILSGFAVVFARNANEAANRSAKAAENTYLASNRSWLPIRISLQGPISIFQSTVQFTLIFEGQPIGNVPAVDVRQGVQFHHTAQVMQLAVWIDALIAEFGDGPNLGGAEVVASPYESFSLRLPVSMTSGDLFTIGRRSGVTYLDAIVVAAFRYQALLDPTRRFSVTGAQIAIAVRDDGTVIQQDISPISLLSRMT